MSATAETTGVQLVTLTINGQELKAEPGRTILEVARAAGIDIPTLCHDPRLEPYGACRMCLVEVEGARGPMAACGTAVREGMKVQTHSEKIVKIRRFVLELLLTNHPLDCPVCEAAGDCRLQDYAYEYLVDMVPWGWRAPVAGDPGSHPNIAHFSARCILCGRCVRICREVMGIGCWGYLNRGYDSEVDTPYRLPLADVDCVSCGQCVSTCPVGAIVGQRTPRGARQWQTEKTVTTCSYCADGCRLVLHSYQGRVVRVTSEVEKGLNGGNLCVKGRFGMGYMESPDRVTTPLVRNGAGELEETTWERALEVIAENIRAVRKDKGGQAIGAICGTHATNEAAYLLQKFMRAVVGSNNVDAIDHSELAATEEALNAVFGAVGATNSRRDLDQADVILLIDADLTASDPVFALDVIKAIRAGKTVIVIDPRETELASKAALHLRVKPGTELAALRAIMRYLVDGGLTDTQFMASRTEGFVSFESGLGLVDLAAESAACDISAELLEATAMALGRAEAATVIYGPAAVQGPKGVSTAAALAYLVMLTGNVGRPGAGLIPLRSGANSQGLVDMGVRPNRLPGDVSLGDPQHVARVEAAWGVGLGDLARGASVGEMVAAMKIGDMKLLYVLGADPALAVPDEKGVRRALEGTHFVVVQDSYLTDTAAYADVVLPAAVAAEDEGTFTNGERVVQRVRPAVAAAGQSLPDWRVVQRLANALGADWAYAGPADVMREIAEVAPSYKGVSYERLEDEGQQCPCFDPEGEGTPVLHVGGFARGQGVFGALDGGAAPPRTDARFPLALVTGPVREHHATGVRTRRSAGLTRLVADAALQINPVDAKKSGVVDGEQVRVVSRNGGSVEVAVRLTPRVPAGVVFLPGFSAAAPVTRLLGREGMELPAVKVERLASPVGEAEA
jgi:predicted molibdopterin-dependent oxidoreductase YjgC